MKTGERMRELRLEKGITLEEMSKQTGIGRTTLTNYENGVRYPKKKNMTIILDFFNVSQDYLDGKTEVRNVFNFQGIYDQGYAAGLKQRGLSLNFITVPVYSCISCGSGLWIDESPEGYVGVPEDFVSSHNKYFANPAEGDSMEPLISNGDCLVFKQTDSIESGMIGAFSLNGNYYCKRLKMLSDGCTWLCSENEKYEPVKIKPEDDFRTLGLYKIKISKEQ